MFINICWFHLHIKLPSPTLHITLPSSCLFLQPEDGGSILHWNMGVYLPDYITSHSLNFHNCENVKSHVEFLTSVKISDRVANKHGVQVSWLYQQRNWGFQSPWCDTASLASPYATWPFKIKAVLPSKTPYTFSHSWRPPIKRGLL